ncbi:MAG: hypothetical protein ACREUN_02795 [Burkholderiales bacterium]
MKISRQLVVDYAEEFQGLELEAGRAPKIAGELERLVDGALRISGVPDLGDDPGGFLAVLEELADAGDE